MDRYTGNKVSGSRSHLYPLQLTASEQYRGISGPLGSQMSYCRWLASGAEAHDFTFEVFRWPISTLADLDIS